MMPLTWIYFEFVLMISMWVSLLVNVVNSVCKVMKGKVYES